MHINSTSFSAKLVDGNYEGMAGGIVYCYLDDEWREIGTTDVHGYIDIEVPDELMVVNVKMCYGSLVSEKSYLRLSSKCLTFQIITLTAQVKDINNLGIPGINMDYSNNISSDHYTFFVCFLISVCRPLFFEPRD